LTKRRTAKKIAKKSNAEKAPNEEPDPAETTPGPDLYFIRGVTYLGRQIDPMDGHRTSVEAVETWSSSSYPTPEAAAAALKDFVREYRFGSVIRARSEQQRIEWESAVQASAQREADLMARASSDHRAWLGKYNRWFSDKYLPWWNPRRWLLLGLIASIVIALVWAVVQFAPRLR
jgi:hypothetical protein